jgi:hypothetical protein
MTILKAIIPQSRMMAFFIETICAENECLMTSELGKCAIFAD